CHDPEYRRRMGEMSQETRRKMSESIKLAWADEERRQRQRERSLARLGRTEPSRKRAGRGAAVAPVGCEEYRKKLSDAVKAKWADPEWRRMRAERASNRPKSQTPLGDEARKKSSEAAKA